MPFETSATATASENPNLGNIWGYTWNQQQTKMTSNTITISLSLRLERRSATAKILRGLVWIPHRSQLSADHILQTLIDAIYGGQCQLSHSACDTCLLGERCKCLVYPCRDGKGDRKVHHHNHRAYEKGLTKAQLPDSLSYLAA